MKTSQSDAQENIYHLRLEGILDGKWANWFEGFVMVPRDDSMTLLSGAPQDQAALHGVLGRIRSLNLSILFLARTGCPCTNQGCPRSGHCQECAAHYEAGGGLPFCFRPKTRWDKNCAAVIKLRHG